MAAAVTREQVTAYLDAIKAVADAIKELGEVPSGILYAQLMNHLSLEQYDKIIGHLKSAGLVVEKNHLLRWHEYDFRYPDPGSTP